MFPIVFKNLIFRLELAWCERAIALKAVSFALVGIGNTIIDFSIFWTALTYLRWPIVVSNVLAWTVGVTCSYVLNTLITFGPESGRILRRRAYANFVASGIAGMISSTATLFALSYLLPIITAKMISILVSFTINFSLSHFLVFPRTRAH